MTEKRFKVGIKDFGQLPNKGMAVFPNILAGKNFREFVSLMKKAKANKKPIIFGIGAHVIKVGLSPILIALMEEGWIQALAMNGACIIHDFEIAYYGRTSEDVEKELRAGKFGMDEKTGLMLNDAIIHASDSNIGLGESVGRMISGMQLKHSNLSLLAAASRLGITATVHVAIGTDTIHIHPDACGEAIGKTSFIDFRRLCVKVAELDDGGVYVNIGSAVMLPEVFLKALALAKSKSKCGNFTTAVFDFNRHYRAYENVVRRPTLDSGRGFYFIGHHEIMIPLLGMALLNG